MSSFSYDYADSLEKVKINTIAGEIECVGASYNGVAFLIEEAGSNGGRNVVTSMLPFTNQHVNEDTGKNLRQFTMKFYLVGSDVNQKASELEEAFNKEGAFELVHPFYGKLKARCSTYSINYSMNVQEYISGDVTFIPEVDAKKTARSVVDLKGQTVVKSQESLVASSNKFKQEFSILKVAKSVLDGVANTVSDLLDMVEDVRQTMRDINGYVSEVSRIRSNLSLLLTTPADFVARIQDLFTMTRETFDLSGNPADYVNESLTLMGSITVTDGTQTTDELSGQIQSVALMSAACMAARTLTECTFASTQELDELHDKFEDAFESARLKVSSAEDYMQLTDMESAALKYLREEVSKLPVVVNLPLLTSRDAITVCFDCYGNLDKLEDVIERNALMDPMVIERDSLKVLSK